MIDVVICDIVIQLKKCGYWPSWKTLLHLWMFIRFMLKSNALLALSV